MSRIVPRQLLLTLCTALLLAGSGVAQSPGLSYSPTAMTQLADNPLLGNIRPVHDPSIIRQGSTWYVFSTDPGRSTLQTFLPIRCSVDRLTWTLCGSVFTSIPQWIADIIPGVRGLWAPDISFFNGLYHLYYAASTLGAQRSVIGLATNTTLDPADPAYRWRDLGAVIESSPGMDFNAIDPNILVGPAGNVWMTYGSFWTGIKQMQIDPATGLLMKHGKRYDLARRSGVRIDAVEGASLVHHGEFFYLFVSVDFCCNADPATDNYKQAVGRSTSPHGPFLDQGGTPLLAGGGTVLLEGNDAWNAPGGGTVYLDPIDGTSSIVFHAFNMARNRAPTLWIKSIDWTSGWPVLEPDRYSPILP